MDEFVAFIIKALATLFVVGAFILGYEQIRLLVVTLYRFIKEEIRKNKEDK